MIDRSFDFESYTLITKKLASILILWFTIQAHGFRLFFTCMYQNFFLFKQFQLIILGFLTQIVGNMALLLSTLSWKHTYCHNFNKYHLNKHVNIPWQSYYEDSHVICMIICTVNIKRKFDFTNGIIITLSLSLSHRSLMSEHSDQLHIYFQNGWSLSIKFCPGVRYDRVKFGERLVLPWIGLICWCTT